jgi:tetratricopeptide (TPR) repeat protein
VDVMQEKIYGNMSSAHLKLGNWQRALDTAEQCLRKNPQNHKARFKKAKALGEIGFYERAEPILLDLLKQTPAGACRRPPHSAVLTYTPQRRRASTRRWRA